jgi:hypothetical protein
MGAVGRCHASIRAASPGRCIHSVTCRFVLRCTGTDSGHCRSTHIRNGLGRDSGLALAQHADSCPRGLAITSGEDQAGRTGSRVTAGAFAAPSGYTSRSSHPANPDPGGDSTRLRSAVSAEPKGRIVGSGGNPKPKQGRRRPNRHQRAEQPERRRNDARARNGRRARP